MSIHRGVLAALVLSAAFSASAPLAARAAAPVAPAAQSKLAAGESVLADGLTIAVRRATLSPTAALDTVRRIELLQHEIDPTSNEEKPQS